MPSIKSKPNTKKRASTKKAVAKRVTKKAVVVKSTTKKAPPARVKAAMPTGARKGRKPSRKTVALPKSIVETSPITWSHDSIGPTFDEIQLAAYHKWLQHGGTDLENWKRAESDLRRGAE